MDFLSTTSPDTDSHDSGLDIYETPEYTSNFANQSDVVLQPTCPPSDSRHATYTFLLGGKDDKLYSIPSSIKVFGRIRVQLQNGTPLSTEVLAPVCNFPEAIFENISVSLNGVPISDHGRAYGYKAFITKKLSLNPTTKKSSLLSNYWVEEDEIGATIKLDHANLTNAFKARSKFIEKSQDVYFVFTPLVDILNTEKYLPPHMELKMEFERGGTSVSLLSPDESLDINIKMLDINMSVRRFLPDPSIAIAHEKRFLSGDFVNMPFTRTSVRHRQLHAGVLTTAISGIFSGQLPYSMVAVFLTNEQQNMISHDPYVFKNHGLKKFHISKNGVNIPQEPITVGGDGGGTTLRGYTHFVENTGSSILSSTNGITPLDFINKSFFMAFDLTPDFCLGAHNHKPEIGNIDLHLQFDKPTTVPLTVMIMACYENVVKVSKDAVQLDYAL